MSYDDPKYAADQSLQLSGNDSTTLLLTPQAGTGAETKTHTTTCKQHALGKRISLKKLSFLVQTAQTGAGNNLALDVMNGTTSVGSLSVTTQTAGEVVTMASDLNSEVASTGNFRVIAKSTTTASDANAAVGTMTMSYQELYA